MSALMRQKMPALRALAGGALLLSLVACEHYMPNSRPDRDSTEAITRAQSERLQASGVGRVMAPSQIRIPTGFRQAEDGECREWLDTCWEKEAGQAPAASQAGVPELVRLSRPADTQTFRGMLPCLEDTMDCRGQHAVLSLSANRSWHARVNSVGADGKAGAASQLQGCWARGSQDPRQLMLYLASGKLLTELQAASSNNLVVVNSSEHANSLRYTLTRQPEADTASTIPVVACPAP